MAAEGGLTAAAGTSVASRPRRVPAVTLAQLDLRTLDADEAPERRALEAERRRRVPPTFSAGDLACLRAFQACDRDPDLARNLAVRLTRRLGADLIPVVADSAAAVAVAVPLVDETLVVRIPRDAFEAHAHLTGLERARGLGSVLARLRSLHRQWGAPFGAIHNSLLVATVRSPAHLLDVAEEGRVPTAAVADLAHRLHVALRKGCLSWNHVAPFVEELTAGELVRSPRNRARLRSLQFVRPVDDALASRVFGVPAATSEMMRALIDCAPPLAASPVLSSMQDRPTTKALAIHTAAVSHAKTTPAELGTLLDEIGIEPERRALDRYEPTMSFVAHDTAGRLVGMIAAHPSSKRPGAIYIPWIAVRGVQGRGVGLALMRRLLVRAMAGGYRGLMGTSQAQYPTQAHFYDHLGARRLQALPAQSEHGAQWVHGLVLRADHRPEAPILATSLLSEAGTGRRMFRYGGDLTLQRRADGGQRRRLDEWQVASDGDDRLVDTALPAQLAELPLGERLRVLDHLRLNGSPVEHVTKLRALAVQWRQERLQQWWARAKAAHTMQPRWQSVDEDAFAAYFGPELRRLAHDDPAAAASFQPALGAHRRTRHVGR